MTQFDIASKAIYNAYASSETQVLLEAGYTYKNIKDLHLKRIERLTCIISLLLTVSMALESYRIPCMNPLTGMLLTNDKDIGTHEAREWRHLIRTAITVGDIWEYVLTINDLNPSIVKKVQVYDHSYFSKVLKTPIAELKRFEFAPPA